VVDGNILHFLAPSTVRIAQQITGDHLPIYTSLEWCNRFPPGKAAMLYKAYLELHGPAPRIYKSFVKREKSVIKTEDLPLIEAECDNGKVSTPGPSPIKLDARGISVPEASTRAVTGPWCWALNQLLARRLKGQFFYNPGSTPKQTSEWVRFAIHQVASGKWPYALAVQGDDALLIYIYDGVIHFLSSDMSRYDMSIRTWHFMMAWAVLDQAKIYIPREVMDIFYEQQGITGKRRIYHTPHFLALVWATMASGDGCTIHFNSIILMLVLDSYMNQKGDKLDFVTFCHELGFTVTYQNHSIADIIKVDFLQSRMWPTADGTRVFGPKPGRIMARFFYIDRFHRNENFYKAEARTMAKGLLSIASHVPIINDICQRVIQLTGHLEDARIVNEDPEEIQSWRVGSYELESPLCVTEMASLYSLTVEDIEDLRIRCRSWSFCEPIDNTIRLTHTVRRMADVDLE